MCQLVLPGVRTGLRFWKISIGESGTIVPLLTNAGFVWRNPSRPTHPPTSQEFPSENHIIYQMGGGGAKLVVNFWETSFSLPLTPPPPFGESGQPAGDFVHKLCAFPGWLSRQGVAAHKIPRTLTGHGVRAHTIPGTDRPSGAQFPRIADAKGGCCAHKIPGLQNPRLAKGAFHKGW